MAENISGQVQDQGGQGVLASPNTVAVFLQIDDTSLLAGVSSIVMEKLTVKANEFEALKSQQMLDEVSYSNSMRAANDKIKLLTARVEVAEKDSQSLREASEDNSKSRVEAEHKVQLLETKNAELLERITGLNQRIEQLAAEKLETLQTAERRANEIKDLRKEVDESRNQLLETKKLLVEQMNDAQEAKSSLSSSKIRQQNLEQELELLKKSNDWLDNELKNKSEEFRAWRSDRLARITELESELDTLKADHSALQQSFNNTKERLVSISEKYDEALVKIKDLQTAESVSKEEFRMEMADQKRRTELWEKAARNSQERLEEVNRLLAEDRNRDGSAVAKWRTEAQKYRQKVEQLQKKLSLMEEADFSVLAGNAQSPQPNANASANTSVNAPFTPSRNMTSNSPGIEVFSPSAKVISEMQKSGGSLVKLYSDFQEVKLRLERERHKNGELRMEMDRILEEMEAHAPTILAEREANQRLEGELAAMSARLSSAVASYEKLEASFKEQGLKFKDSERERQLLSQHIKDLARQLQQVLIQNRLLSDSDDAPLSADEHDALQKLLAGQDVDLSQYESAGFTSDGQKAVSARLVLFKDIVTLQQQNSDLLNTVRQLNRDIDEKDRALQQHTSGPLSMETIAETLEQLEARLKQKETLIENLQHERDLFRSMLSSKDHNNNNSNSNNSNNNGNVSSGTHDLYVQQLLKQLEAASKEVERVKSEHSAYEAEINDSMKFLNEQNRDLSGEKAALELKYYTAKNSLELASERFKSVNEDLELIKKENSQLRVRNQELQDNLFKQDMRTQQVSEELIQARSKIESIQSEAANLKAEKSLWKSIEERLTKENSELLEERGRLNGILTNVQVMESEREARAAESQRQLLSQIETLNNQVANLEKRLEQEQAELRKISERRELETSTAQTKIDMLSRNLSTAKEEIATYKMQSTELETKVKDLNARLVSSEEKLKIYQQQATTDPTSLSSDQSVVVALREELASLRAELKLKESELKNAKEHNEQLTNLATASEEGIKDMTETVQVFEGNMKQQLASKDAEIAKLTEELSSVREQLDSVNSQLAEGQSSLSERVTTLEAEKTQLESSVKLLKESEAHLREVETNLKSDLDQQRSIAQSARANYEQEVVKHGETTNTLQKLRSEYGKLKEEVLQLASKAKQSSQALENAETSWANQKYVLEHEIEELKSRFEDASSQNRILLEQLEKVTSNATATATSGGSGGLSASSASSIPESDSETVVSGSGDVEMFRGEIGYLKRQMGFIEEKYEASVQEAKRLKQRLDHTTANLDEVKTQLELERQKSGGSVESEEKDHQKIMSQLTDLNVLRESNDSLRQQCQYYSKKCEDLEKKVEELIAKVEPLEEQLRQSVAESEAKDQQIALLKKDNTYWKERTQKVLQKTEQVDVDEYNRYKAAVETLEGEKKQLQEQISRQEQELGAEVSKQRDQLQAEIAKIKEEYENLSTRFNNLRKESQDKLQKRRAENYQLKEELTKVKAELEQANKAAESAMSQAKDAQSQADTAASSSKNASDESVQALVVAKEKRIAELEEQINQVSDEATDLQNMLKTYEQKIAKVDGLERTNQQLKEEIDSLKRQVASSSSGTGSVIDDDDKTYQAKIQELEKQHAENLSRLDTEREQWKANIRAKFNETLKQQRQKDAESLKKAIEEAKSNVGGDGDNSAQVKELEAKLASLEEKHKQELASMADKTREMVLKETSMRMTILQNKATKLEQELKALKGEPATSSSVKPTGAGSSMFPPSAPGSRLPVFNRQALAKAKPAATTTTAASDDGPRGEKRPLDQTSNPTDEGVKKLKEDGNATTDTNANAQ